MRVGRRLTLSAVLHVHSIEKSYECEEARSIALEWPVVFDEVIRQLANRMAMDATKIHPVPPLPDGFDCVHIARVLRGMTAGAPGQMQLIFAYSIRKRYMQHESACSSELLDMSPARREILSGWAGRAPCFAEGDKIDAVSLFENFALGSQLIRELGEAWKGAFF